MSAQQDVLVIYVAVVLVLGGIAFGARSRRVAVLARVALVLVAFGTVAVLWIAWRFQRDFTIPPM